MSVAPHATCVDTVLVAVAGNEPSRGPQASGGLDGVSRLGGADDSGATYRPLGEPGPDRTQTRCSPDRLLPNWGILAHFTTLGKDAQMPFKMIRYRSPAAFVAFVVLVVGTVLVGPAPTASAQVTFVNRTTANGLGSNQVFGGLFVDGSKVYAATTGGLGISTDGGATFVNRSTADGLGSNLLQGVFVDGSTIYVGTGGLPPAAGLSISTDGGATFTNRTTANGLGSNNVRSVFVVGSTVYAATAGGLSISTDGGATFTNRTTANGLGGNGVSDVFVDGSTVYAAISLSFPGGVSISTDGGATFVNRTSANGLGNNEVYGVFASGSMVYAATQAGLGISADGGATFVNYTTANGLGNEGVRGVFAAGSTVYAATDGGLSIGSEPTVPGSPTGVSGVAGNGEVTVSWTAPADDGGSAITGYAVTASPGGQTCTTTGATSCVVSGLTNGTPYTFTVVATNAVGDSSSSGASAPVTPDVAIPGSPSGVSGVAGNGEVTVSWTAPADDGGSAVTGYAVTASPGGQTCTTTGATSCVVSGLTNGTAYTFTVVATNEAGNSLPSEASAPVTPSNSTPTPKSLTLVAGFGVGDTVRNGNASLTASRQGVAPFPELVLVLRSVPQVGVGTVLGASTDASVVGAVPANLAAGVYSVTAETIDSEDNLVTSTVWFTVNLTGTVTALSSEGPTPPPTTPVAPHFTG